jgi:predicted CoA-binding protein
MNSTIKEFVQIKQLAVLGASRSGTKFGNYIANELKQRGYQVYLVHPEGVEIGGEKSYPNLAALQGKVEGVVICLPPAAAVTALRDAAVAGIKHIWLQQGAQSAETAAMAKELGLDPVTGKCILMYAEPVTSFHTWHRGFARLFGQY